MPRSEFFHNAFFGGNPYEGFPISDYTLDMQGWGSWSPVFETIIATFRPRLVVEVGSWKGTSAINMVNIAKKHGIEGFTVICIDTWLGSHEHWLERNDPTFFKSLNLKNGYPTLYYQFLANVILSGHADSIVPLPLPSVSAAQVLSTIFRGELQADMIYLDAGHAYEDVIQDIRIYWPLLRQNGVFLGDDYNPGWAGVIRACTEFAHRQGETLNVRNEKWWIQKLSQQHGA